MRLLTVIVILIAFCGIAAADNCGRPVIAQRNQVVAQQQFINTQHGIVQQVVNPVAVANFVPIAVAVPQFSVGYNQQGDLAQAIKELTEEIRQLKLNGGGNGGTPVEPPSVTADAISVMSTNCASCHTGESSKKKYKIFVTKDKFNEDLFKDPLERMHVRDRVKLGQMPPPEAGDVLSDEEQEKIEKWAQEGVAKSIETKRNGGLKK